MENLDRTLWERVRQRVLERAGGECEVASLDARPCSDGPLHVHHVDPEHPDPYDEAKLVAVCATHHGILEYLRSRVPRRGSAACPHRHPYPEGRRQCEARRARGQDAQLVA